eukprot:1175157-Pleurochrysis_carterae.AAC.1
MQPPSRHSLRVASTDLLPRPTACSTLGPDGACAKITNQIACEDTVASESNFRRAHSKSHSFVCELDQNWVGDNTTGQNQDTTTYGDRNI